MKLKYFFVFFLLFNKSYCCSEFLSSSISDLEPIENGFGKWISSNSSTHSDLIHVSEMEDEFIIAYRKLLIERNNPISDCSVEIEILEPFLDRLEILVKQPNLDKDLKKEAEIDSEIHEFKINTYPIFMEVLFRVSLAISSINDLKNELQNDLRNIFNTLEGSILDLFYNEYENKFVSSKLNTIDKIKHQLNDSIGIKGICFEDRIQLKQTIIDKIYSIYYPFLPEDSSSTLLCVGNNFYEASKIYNLLYLLDELNNWQHL